MITGKDSNITVKNENSPLENNLLKFDICQDKQQRRQNLNLMACFSHQPDNISEYFIEPIKNKLTK